MHKKFIHLIACIFTIMLLSGCGASTLRERLTGVPDGIMLSDAEVADALPALEEKSFYHILDEDGQSATGIWKSDIIDENGLTTFIILLNGNAAVSDFVKREEFVKKEYGVKILVRENLIQSGFYPSDYLGILKIRALLKGKSLQGEVLRTSIAESAKDEFVKPAKVPKHSKRK